MKINILGSGSWGTALSIVLSRNGHEVALLGRDQDEVDSITGMRENLRYLPGFMIPKNVTPKLIDDGLPECDYWVVAVPSSAFEQVTRLITEPNPRIVIATKGLIPTTGQVLSDYITDHHPGSMVGAISGPNLAVELARGAPTVAVAAGPTEQDAEKIALLFNCPNFRVYLSDDLKGIEIAGALKNVLAISAGMSDGLGFGDNTKAALLARGLYEMTKLGTAMGARPDTFFGVAGVGDLIATAVSKLSRNYRFGFAVGEGHSRDTALTEVGQTVEGIPTSEAAVILSRKLMVMTPIFEATHAVIHEKMEVRQCVEMLMDKLPRKEGLMQFLQETIKPCSS